MVVVADEAADVVVVADEAVDVDVADATASYCSCCPSVQCPYTANVAAYQSS